MTAEHIHAFKELLSRAQTVLVILPKNPKPDQASAGLSLHLGLQSLAKNSSVLSPTDLGEQLQNLAGATDVSTQLGNKNLQVSFPYQEDSVDKVDYHIDEETNTFNLVIQPKKGKKPLDSSAVVFTHVGAEADLIVTIGVANLESLDALYLGYEDVYDNSPLVSINTYETTFGTLKVDVSSSASYSEVIAFLLQEIGVTLDADMSTNLLSGLEDATDTFRSLSTTAETLEIASKLLRMGARRMSRSVQDLGKKGEKRSVHLSKDKAADTTLHHRPIDGGSRA